MPKLNDLLYEEWNYNKNKDLTPDKFTSHSGKVVWWKCKEGHEWKAIIASRSNGRGCPYCSGKLAITGKNDLITINSTLAAEWNFERNEGIKPDDYKPFSHKKVWWICKDGHEWIDSIAHRSVGRGCPYCSGRRLIPGKTDLLTLSPNISKQWDYKMNRNLKPENFTKYSHKVVFWRCDMNHVWEAAIADRNKAECPYCSGRMAITGETDLKSKNPSLADEWNYDKNINLVPENFTAFSNKSVWWKCKEGHEWKSSINNRQKGKGCPYCAGKRAILGETDLISTVPHLLNDWDYDKNININPKEITKSSNRKVWWKCKNNHKWLAMVSSRTKGSGCPYCSGFKAIIGETDLATLDPKICEEWNYQRNINILPEHFTLKSGRKVWWMCKYGHEWRASITNRTSKGTGCPYCTNYNYQ